MVSPPLGGNPNVPVMPPLRLLPLVLALAVVPAAPAAEDGAAAWEAHGFTSGQRAALREVWAWGIAGRFVPGGVMLVVHRGEVVFREAFGVADLASGRAFTPDLPCRIASVTKPHTATLLALLVEEGRLGWDDPVERHLPAFRGVRVMGERPAARSPRVRELLSHTAGFAPQGERGDERWRIRGDGSLADAVDDLARAGLATEPGARFAYTGFGYMVAGRIAEVVTGREFAELMRERLLVPIGAGGAAFLPRLAAAERARLPVMYERSGDTLVPAAASGRDEPVLAFPNPGGGLVATADDVMRLLRLHRNGGMAGGRRLVSAATLAELHRVQPATGRDGYGLGFNIVRADADGRATRLRHNGASGTFAFMDLREDLLVVALTQVPTKQRMPFTRRLDAAVDAVLLGGR